MTSNKDKYDLISCIITTHKRPVEILKRAINSVINQTYQNIELIVVNDYPEDKKLSNEVESLVKSYNLVKIKYSLLLHNSGACYARNEGAKLSSGKYLAFLDDDDEWLPNKLEEQIKLFTTNNVGLVYCDSYIIRGKRKKLNQQINPNKYNNDYKQILLGNFIGGVSFPLINRKIFFEVGGFDDKMPSNQDTDLWIRIMKKYKALHCSKPLLNYYMSSDSITKNIKKKLDGYNLLLSKYSTEYDKYKDVFIQKNINIGNVFTNLGEFEIANNFYSQAIKFGGKKSTIKKNKMKSYLHFIRNKIKK